MAKSIEPEVKDWFAQALSQHKTKYCIEQGTLNIEIENADTHIAVVVGKKQKSSNSMSCSIRKLEM